MCTCCYAKRCDNATGAFLLQKLKLSITPYALNKKSKMPYYEMGGETRPGLAVISYDTQPPEKPPIQTNL